jgi:transcriptional regulator with XRE-family HTH domain
MRRKNLPKVACASQDPRWFRYVELHRKYLYMSYGNYDFRTSELAKALGVNRRTIQRWMKGIGSPREKHLKVIASFISERKHSL